MDKQDYKVEGPYIAEVRSYAGFAERRKCSTLSACKSFAQEYGETYNACYVIDKNGYLVAKYMLLRIKQKWEWRRVQTGRYRYDSNEA